MKWFIKFLPRSASFLMEHMMPHVMGALLMHLVVGRILYWTTNTELPIDCVPMANDSLAAGVAFTLEFLGTFLACVIRQSYAKGRFGVCAAILRIIVTWIANAAMGWLIKLSLC